MKTVIKIATFLTLIFSIICNLQATNDDDYQLLSRKRSNATEPNSATKRSKRSVCFESKIKSKIEEYIPQVFKIICANDKGGHIGTAWMFNARYGILATNHHVIPPEFGVYSIEDRAGNVYTNVRVLGVSPSSQCGDFGFVQVPELAGQFKQMPMVKTHNVNLYDPVAFMGNSYGHFSVEEGTVNELYDFGMEKVIESFVVNMICRGGASGSPTFNRQGQINGILYAGNDIRAIVHPVWFLQRAYKIMMSESVLQPLSLTTFHALFETQTMHNIVKYHELEEADLEPYIVDEEKTRKSFLTFQEGYKSQEGIDAIEDEDVLLAVNRQKIGCNTIKITKILDALRDQTQAKLTILRSGKIMEISVIPEKVVQSYAKRIIVDNLSIYSKSSSFFNGTMFTSNSPIATACRDICELETRSVFGRVISHVGQIKVTTFEDFLKALHKKYIKQKHQHMIFTLRSRHGAVSRHNIDLITSAFQQPLVNFFENSEGMWKKILLSKYITKHACRA